jgi:DNA-directed RNA polymerase subunit RPC12/RpoP/predicted lipid-binding transport protein (Tim44 family)
MKPGRKKLFYRGAWASLACLLLGATYSWARVGGAGGHGGGGGGLHGGGGGGGIPFIGGGGSTTEIVIIIIIIIIVYAVRYNNQQKAGGGGGGEMPESTVPFPEGLDATKVANSFMAIQDAWQRKDLSQVRKWLSDGMYQRLTTQFNMMNKLGQSNTLSNIRINGIAASETAIDGKYRTAEVAISFTMDDSFTSSKYPEFNESYQGDSDTEYWTFIKRIDSTDEKNLYDNNNCPNCGAPFEVKMGEISRCSNCNTLTNSAAYDWVLSEITQADDYSGGAGLVNDATLKELMKNDPFFAVQRMEDIASNIFMQIMDVYTGGDDEKRLTRFADDKTTQALLQQKRSMRPFVFDRLYLNNVTLTNYSIEENEVKLRFSLNATYRRVATGARLQMLDGDFVTTPATLELSRNKNVLAKTGETVYSYECSSCGAPYTDTTEDHCNYCDAPVIDKQRNWVLTGFSWNA